MRRSFILVNIAILIVIAILAQFFWPPVLWSLLLLIPVLILGLYDMWQSPAIPWYVISR